MGQANQIYCRFKRLLVNPTNPLEYYLVIEKEKPFSIETIKKLEEQFVGKELIFTLTELIRRKKRNE